MVCVLSLISPDFQQGLFTTPGMVCIVLAAAMDGVALLVIRRILEGVV
jgi:tight adherence protein B